jgi:hypothetical protein
MSDKRRDCRFSIADFRLRRNGDSTIIRLLPSAFCLLYFSLSLLSVLFAPGFCLSAGRPAHVRYDGASWKLKGDGVVCCPCTVPCPCRSNSAPSFGHCEATLYLRVRQGSYGTVSLDGMQVIDTGGMCAVNYSRLSALYFDRAASAAQQSAFMKIVASFSPKGVADFPYVRVVGVMSRVTGDHRFDVSIPGTLEIIIDRNWGQRSPPMPLVAAPDEFSNAIQYVQNIRYRIHDPGANLDFDYSHRQANYRLVDLTVDRYRSKAMLIEFEDGKGWFNSAQMQLIRAQHLAIPQLDTIRKEALRLRDAGSE